ncbi:sensor histidine kinase [Cohnella thailandensis]|uniref:histidine kinase n=1 Tax=Cohnella thailandensis TaxID=557557 RepID=A0A841SZN7_9BACL|nr:sensor histidine kinase [Cohnella thailandensis]MBB6637653.1 sensor histidine kinase [Cohnella thailandensis]MBP1974170.1 signal transduction histidine kinase [Cohnella thailandensis]
MKLFLREHGLLVVLQFVQLALVLSVYVLDGYRDWRTGFYAVFIGMFVLLGYLVYRYFRHARMYKLLSAPPLSLEESIAPLGEAAVPGALHELLQNQYRQYQHQAKAWEHHRRDHLSFMNQWVHQMKTPLAVIHLTVQNREEPSFASIGEEAERLEQGLEKVLYAARLEAFEQDFQAERVNLRELAAGAINEHKRLFIRSEVYPDNQVDPELWVETDAKWMRFVLNQIVSNAIKYSAGSRTKVTFEAKADGGGNVTLEIRDRGVGIPLSDRKRVFQPFFTGENGRQFRESTGMGLYLAKKICDQLQHPIGLESAVGEGTVLRISFRQVQPYTDVR